MQRIPKFYVIYSEKGITKLWREGSKNFYLQLIGKNLRKRGKKDEWIKKVDGNYYNKCYNYGKYGRAGYPCNGCGK